MAEPLAFSLHARKRMRDRRITPDEVSEALDNVHTRYPSTNPGTEVVLGVTSTGRRLKVIVSAQDSWFVVSVAARDEDD